MRGWEGRGSWAESCFSACLLDHASKQLVVLGTDGGRVTGDHFRRVNGRTLLVSSLPRLLLQELGPLSMTNTGTNFQ